MTRMTGPDCVVMCNLINTYIQVSLIPPREDQREWHRMTRMTRLDCAVMCNLTLREPSKKLMITEYSVITPRRDRSIRFLSKK